MKSIKLYIIAIFSVALSLTTFAQHDHSSMGSSSNMNMNMNMNQNPYMNMTHPKTESLKVWGKCEMCKARIEKIALANGASNADWNVKSKILTVDFDPMRSSMDYISGKLAKAGHDTGMKSAKDKAYNALPECCKYERVRE
jgi:mercuric ion binding protein